MVWRRDVEGVERRDKKKSKARNPSTALSTAGQSPPLNAKKVSRR